MQNESPDAASELRLVSGWTRYPDLHDEPEHFIALDGEGAEVGSVNRTASSSQWEWTLDRRHRRADSVTSTAGTCSTREEAQRALARCYNDFRAHNGTD